MPDSPTAPPPGRSRVPRFLDEAEQAAGSGGSLDQNPPPPPPPPSPIQFINGHAVTPEIAAKRGAALQQLLKDRDRADADPDDSDTQNA
jgi:hypothetical protein